LGTLTACHEFASTTNIGAVDVMAIQLRFGFLVQLKHPSNILSGVGPGIGATLFDLKYSTGTNLAFPFYFTVLSTT